MPSLRSNRSELHGWKEIAAYLGVSVRCAQMWVKRNLPVHRFPGRKGSVWGSPNELESWKLGRPCAPRSCGLREELEGWKAIASLLGVAVRTAQDWEAKRALPVHRLPGDKGRVYAHTDELEQWRLGSTVKREVETKEEENLHNCWASCVFCRQVITGESLSEHFCKESYAAIVTPAEDEWVEFLMWRYGLTKAEARLAERLVSGGNLLTMARDLRISSYTARGYVKQVLLKAHVRRQIDFVRLVLATVMDGGSDVPRSAPTMRIFDENAQSWQP